MDYKIFIHSISISWNRTVKIGKSYTADIEDAGCIFAYEQMSRLAYKAPVVVDLSEVVIQVGVKVK